MSRLLRRDIVEVFWVPPGMDHADIWLGRDIFRQRQFEAAQKLLQLRARAEQQRIEAEKEQLKTRTDTVEMTTDLGKR
jgi:hypothetical protein